jgi:hypothetical protein
LAGAAADVTVNEIRTQRKEKTNAERRANEAERRANEAEERNRSFQEDLDELRKDYDSKVNELDSLARRLNLNGSLKVELDIALVEHQNCLRGSDSPNAVRDCYRIYKRAYDLITDTW